MGPGSEPSLPAWGGMSAGAGAAARTDRAGRALLQGAKGLAVAGGFVLAAVAVVTTLSILGRTVAASPVPGDFELVEIGTALAVFAFLPYCQMVRGNVVVDLFTSRAPARVKALLDLAGNLAFTLVAGILTWRMALGGAELRAYAETTMVLRIPVWWGIAAAVPCLGFLTVTCAYAAWRDAAGAASRLRRHRAGARSRRHRAEEAEERP